MDADKNEQIRELLAAGIKAAKAGDTATARDKFEEVIRLDENNKKAWLGLARVVDDVAEKRVCLNNVLMLDPDNRIATKLLARLDRDGAQGRTKGQQPFMQRLQTDRRLMAMVGGGAALIVVVICLLLVVVMSSGGGGEPTVFVPSATFTPSITPTEVPPTWTPVYTQTVLMIPTEPPLPTAPLLDGRLAIASGQTFSTRAYVGIVQYLSDGTSRREVIDPTQAQQRGRNPALSPDGNRIVYEWGQSGRTAIVVVGTDGIGWEQLTFTVTMNTGEAHGFGSEQHASFAANGADVLFEAQRLIPTRSSHIYLYDADGSESGGPAIVPITTDEATNSWPAFSPDYARIVYAARTPGAVGTHDLYIIPAAGGTPTRLTQNDDALIETAPDWQPGGNLIVFEGAMRASIPQGDSVDLTIAEYDSDLYIVDALTLEVTALDAANTPSRETLPRWSPDGNYIAFSSNRSGDWQVYIYDFNTGQLYQLQIDAPINLVYDWGAEASMILPEPVITETPEPTPTSEG